MKSGFISLQGTKTNFRANNCGWGTFKSDNLIFNHARFSAINLIEKSKKIKNRISDFAMGIN